MTESTSAPLALVVAYSSAANPKSFAKVLREESGTTELYAIYLRNRDTLDRKFWEQVRALPESQRAHLSTSMSQEPAYKDLRTIHDLIEKVGKL
jgi:hypothetical protein